MAIGRVLPLVIGLAAAALPALGREASPLAARLDAVLHAPALRGARVAALVVRLDDGAPAFERGADLALAPASNLKILTALAALSTWGPSHRFRTEVYVEPAIDAAGRVERLTVRGGGDPALTGEHWWRLAADLRRLGLRRIDGPIVLDDSWFDRVHWHPAWRAASARAYHAPVGALAANYGAFAVEVRPTRPGQPATVGIDPAVPHLRLSGAVATVGGRAAGVRIERHAADGADRIVVSGSLAAGAPPSLLYRGVSDPTRYAGAVLHMQLAANDIATAGPLRVATVSPAARLVHAFAGRPLAEIVALMMKYSNNNIAECLVKGLGRHATGQAGSWQNGTAAVRAELARLGVPVATLHLLDGSGLAADNRVAPRTLVEALRVGRRSFRFGPEFTAALAIAGTDGTLEHRAERAGAAVRAKSGLLAEAAGLSGYALGADGVEYAFAILVNGPPAATADTRRVLDRFAASLVGAAS